MALRFITRCQEIIRQCEQSILIILNKYPPEDLCVNYIQTEHRTAPSKFSLQDILGDSFLWAVPRNRRTVERRWKRKFGYPEYVWKPLTPKTNLQTCNTCGYDHEIGILCAQCYHKNQEETNVIKEKIQNELGLDPIEKEVVVLYEGEKQQQPAEFWQGKRIVELPKQRPPLFSKNLLQRTTQAPATSKDIKPSDLG